MRWRCLAWFVLFLAFCLFPLAWAGYSPDSCNSIVEQTGGAGAIDWSQGFIQATGLGVKPEKYYGKPQARPLAARAAQLDASANLLEAAMAVRIDSQTMVGDILTSSQETQDQLEGMVREAGIVHREYLSDGAESVTVRMPLYGGFAQLVLPPDVVQVPELKPMEPPSAPVPPSPPKAPAPLLGEEKPMDAERPPRPFTGLLVDARGLPVSPALAPRILDEDGREVYGAAFVSREHAVQWGMAAYSGSMASALSGQRTGPNPLVVKGVKAQGQGGSNIIVSNADADLVRGSSENLSFLKKCRVVIVLK